MKRNRIKIAAIVLLILQLALGFKSVMILRGFFGGEAPLNIATTEKVLLFIGFLAGLLISTALVVIIFRALAVTEANIENADENKVVEKKQKPKGKNEKDITGERSQEKKLILEKLTAELSNQVDIELFAEKVLINISKVYDIMQGIFFVKDPLDKVFRKKGTYAYYSDDELREFTEEVGLSGQVAANKKLLNISNIPEKYITVLSGLGKASPANLIILPVVYKNESIGIIELASFKKFDSFTEEILTEFTNSISETLSKISAKEPAAK